MTPPQWIQDEQDRRNSEASAAFDWLSQKSGLFAAMTSREDYIAAYVAEKFEPLTWTTTKEPIARSYAGINGLLTVYPDGREERS